MHKSELKEALLRILTGFGSLALAILFFFFCFRVTSFWGAAKKLLAIVAPFVYGGVMAYLLTPLCRYFERLLVGRVPGKNKKHTARILAIIISMLLAALVIAVLLLLLVPQLVQNVTNLIENMPQYIENTTNWLTQLAADYPEAQSQIVPWVDTALEKLYAWAQNDLLPNWQSLLSGLSLGVMAVLTGLKNFIIGIIVAVYLMASREKFLRQSKAVLYSLVKTKWADRIREEMAYADKMFGSFLYGKVKDSIIIGILCFVICGLLGIPNTTLVSVVIGVTNIIPFFGPFIGAIPCAFLILLVSPIHCLWFVLFIFVLQQFDGNILGPRILGNATGLASFWVLFSILLFGGLFGFVGMIVGVPLFAVIYDVLFKLIRRGLIRHGKEHLLQAPEGEE